MAISPQDPPSAARRAATLRDYIALARPDHWIKHIFILPGIALAVVLLEPRRGVAPGPVLLGLLAAGLIASANYVINEWLDARQDAHHPEKAARAAVQARLSRGLVLLEYAALTAAGLLLAAAVGKLFLAGAIALWLSGIAYNVPPLRLKEIAYVDVLVESVNNPIRLSLGWAMVDDTTLPPGTLLITYWLSGAFLMATKRFAEYRTIVARAGTAALALYRRSFARTSESALLTSAVVYALSSVFAATVFLLKYRIEYLLAMPLVVALFARYLAIGLGVGSAAAAPERLFRERSLIALVAALLVVLAVTTFIQLPGLDGLTTPHYIRLPVR